MCKKKINKKQYTMGIEFSFCPTKEINRDKEIEKRSFKLFDKMSKEFAIAYKKAVMKMLDNEECEYRDKKHMEDVIVRSSVKNDITFNELIEELKG